MYPYSEVINDKAPKRNLRVTIAEALEKVLTTYSKRDKIKKRETIQQFNQSPITHEVTNY